MRHIIYRKCSSYSRNYFLSFRFGKVVEMVNVIEKCGKKVDIYTSIHGNVCTCMYMCVCMCIHIYVCLYRQV